MGKGFNKGGSGGRPNKSTSLAGKYGVKKVIAPSRAFDPAARKAKNPAVGDEKPEVSRFEILTKKKHFATLGDRYMVRQHVSESRTRGEELRRNTLAKEIERLGKRNTFVDRRIGEGGSLAKPLSEDEKRMKKFEALKMEWAKKESEKFKRIEKMRAAKKGGKGSSKFALPDEDDKLGGDNSLSFTHMGKPLETEDDYKDNYMADEHNPGAPSYMGAMKFTGFNEQNPYAGAEMPDDVLEKFAAESKGDRPKSKKEIMQEVIVKSKMHRLERKIDKEKMFDKIDELDLEFKNINALIWAGGRPKPTADSDDEDTAAVLASVPKLPEIEDIPEPDDFDKALFELQSDRRAFPTDRLKTDQEMALEETQRMEKLEAARLKRMQGEEEESSDDESKALAGGGYRAKRARRKAQDEAKAAKQQKREAEKEEGSDDSDSEGDSDDDDDEDDEDDSEGEYSDGDFDSDEEEEEAPKKMSEREKTRLRKKKVSLEVGPQSADSLEIKLPRKLKDLSADEVKALQGHVHDDEDFDDSDDEDGSGDELGIDDDDEGEDEDDEEEGDDEEGDDLEEDDDDGEIDVSFGDVLGAADDDDEDEEGEGEEDDEEGGDGDEDEMASFDGEADDFDEEGIEDVFSDEEEEAGSAAKLKKASKSSKKESKAAVTGLSAETLASITSNVVRDLGLSRNEEAELLASDMSVPFVIEAPTNYAKFLTLLKPYNLSQRQLVVERIFKYHPFNLHGNKTKMEGFFGVLAQYMDDLYSQSPMPAVSHLNTIYSQLVDLGRKMPMVAGNYCRARLEVLHTNFVASLEARASSSCWPALRDLLFFKLVADLFPVSDKRHEVVSPAVLILQHILSAGSVNSLQDATAGLFVSSLAMTYASPAKRYFPEAITFLCNLVLHTLSTSEDRSAQLSASELRTLQLSLPSATSFADGLLLPVAAPDVAADSKKPKKKAKSVAIVEPEKPLAVLEESDASSSSAQSVPIPLSALSGGPDDINCASSGLSVEELKQRLVQRTLDLCLQFAQLYSSAFPSFPELFGGLMLPALRVIKSDSLDANSRLSLVKLQEFISSTSASIVATRQHVQFRKHKVTSIREYNPRLLSTLEFSATGGIGVQAAKRGLNTEKAKIQLLKKKVRVEFRSAARELRKDAAFVQQAELERRQREDAERDKKNKAAMLFIQQQAASINQMEVIQARDKRREKGQKERFEKKAKKGLVKGGK